MRQNVARRIGIGFVLTLLWCAQLPAGGHAADVFPAEARAIAREAYVYGLPLVMNYKAMYLNAVLKESLEFKAPFNQIKNMARVYTPEDKAFVTPNSDTPYSWSWLDLRAEPVVLSTPQVEPGRYYSAQLIDLYTFNFAYLGTRATGNAPGHFLIAGPGWEGESPKGISRILRSETPLVVVLYRTQLFGPDDLENVKKIQAGYQVQTLSKFLGTRLPDCAKSCFPCMG